MEMNHRSTIFEDVCCMEMVKELDWSDVFNDRRL